MYSFKLIIGKTTTVALVCKELDFDVVEFNASDTRNKTLIKEQIGDLVTTTSLSAYAIGKLTNFPFYHAFITLNGP